MFLLFFFFFVTMNGHVVLLSKVCTAQNVHNIAWNVCHVGIR